MPPAAFMSRPRHQTLSQAIRDEIAERGITITAAAELGGWNRPSLSHWMAGRRPMPLRVAERLARQLGIEIHRPGAQPARPQTLTGRRKTPRK